MLSQACSFPETFIPHWRPDGPGQQTLIAAFSFGRASLKQGPNEGGHCDE